MLPPDSVFQSIDRTPEEHRELLLALTASEVKSYPAKRIRLNLAPAEIPGLRFQQPVHCRATYPLRLRRIHVEWSQWAGQLSSQKQLATRFGPM